LTEHGQQIVQNWFERAEIRLLIQLNAKVDILMSGLADLQAANSAQADAITAQGTAITGLLAEWSTFLADVQGALSNGDSDAAVEAASQLVVAQTATIAEQTAQLTAQTAAMAAADPSTPQPAPAPAPSS